jgi:hypothetical protein
MGHLPAIRSTRRWGLTLLALATSCGSLVATAPAAQAATLVVTSPMIGGPGSLLQALADAGASPETTDTITFAPELDGSTITATSQVDITSATGPVVIDGGGTVTISGGGTTRIFRVLTGGDLELRGLTLTGGSNPGGQGGAISTTGDLTVVDSVITGNAAAFGGGIFVMSFGMTRIESSTVSNNAASDRGAGIFANTSSGVNGNLPLASTVVLNSTVADNDGEGIFQRNGRTQLLSSTVTGNSGSGAGSNGNSQAIIELVGSIVVGNDEADVVNAPEDAGAFLSGGGNVIGTGNRAGDFTGPGDIIGATAEDVFGTAAPVLADNGGPTPTVALPSDSIARDRAPAGRAVDQRGEARPYDDPAVAEQDGSDGSDSGAYEARDASTPPPDLGVTDNGDSGPGTLRAALAAAAAAPGPDTITFDLPPEESTVTLTSQLDVTAATGPVVIDGGGTVTLSGGGTDRIFFVAAEGDLELRGLTLTGGRRVGGQGGAVATNGELAVIDTTITDSSAQSGGALYVTNGGSLTVESSTLSGNTATGQGAGIFSNTMSYSGTGALPARTTTVVNSTITDNSGSGIHNFNGFTEVSSSTITGNDRVGVVSFGDALTTTRLVGSIAVGNDGGDVANFVDAGERFQTGGGNVIGLGGPASDFTGPGDLTGATAEQVFGTADPVLADNGGPTPTVALSPGSIALDRAPAGPAVDQRGETRPYDDLAVENQDGSDGSDAGAFEAQEAPVDDPRLSGLDGDAVTYTDYGDDVRLDVGGDAGVVVDRAITGVALRVSIVTNRDTDEDVLGIATTGPGTGTGRDQISVDGNRVELAGRTFGTFSGGTGTEDLVFDFDGQVESEELRPLLRVLTYRNLDVAAPTAAVRAIEVTLEDSRRTIDTASVTVDVVGWTAEPGGPGGPGSPDTPPVNQAPTALPDAYAVAEDTTLTRSAAAGVLANDSDADGAALTATLVDAPSQGTLTLSPDGSFIYTPAPGYAGPDSFTYRASDGRATSATTTVSLDVTAEAPVTDVPPTLTIDAARACGQRGAATVVVNVVDPDTTSDLTPTATTDDRALTGAPAVRSLGDGRYVVSVRPSRSRSGTARITVSVTDGTSTSRLDFGVLVGTRRADVLTGTGGTDLVVGRGGDDLVRGRAGLDGLCGGAGDDRLRGGQGNDDLRGGPGDDDLRGGPGVDRLDGGPGDDRGTDRA